MDSSVSRLDEVIAKSEIESEIAVLDSFEKWLGHETEIKLMKAAQPAVVSNHAPADASRNKLGRDLVILRRIVARTGIPTQPRAQNGAGRSRFGLPLAGQSIPKSPQVLENKR